MDQTGPLSVLEVLLIAMLGMFVLAIAFVIFFVAYQRKLAKQQQEQRDREALYQQDLLRAIVESQEKERDRMAKDLHDDIGAMLTTIKLYAEQLDMAEGEEELARLKDKTTGLIDETIGSVRRISYDLHPLILKNFGLQEATEALARRINAADGPRCETDFCKPMPNLDYPSELAIFRIIQELLSNSLKYADAHTIHIHFLTYQDQLAIHYTDDGKGYDPAVPDLKRGLGLRNIESRASLIGGRVSYDQVDGHTRFTLTKDIMNNE